MTAEGDAYGNIEPRRGRYREQPRRLELHQRRRDDQELGGNVEVERIHLGEQREVFQVTRAHSLKYRLDDLIGRARDCELVLHIGRPFERTHPHHGPGGILTPLATQVAGDGSAGIIPRLLGVEEHPVQIEDDCTYLTDGAELIAGSMR
jgi:hypothetical protein